MPRTRCNAAITTVFITMAGDRRRSIRSNEDAPELTNPFVRSVVSCCVDPLPPLALFLPLTPISTGAESSPPPWFLAAVARATAART